MLESRAELKTGYRVVVSDTRGHEIFTDLSEDFSGNDDGTTPVELLVMAYASCTVTVFKMVVDKMRIELEELTVNVKADKPNPTGSIVNVRCKINVKSSADEEKLNKILNIVIKSCPAGTILEKANIPVKIQLDKVRD
ncbi:MAG: OsmC family protein [Candidatus Hodarchaeales archaeon]